MAKKKRKYSWKDEIDEEMYEEMEKLKKVGMCECGEPLSHTILITTKFVIKMCGNGKCQIRTKLERGIHAT